MTAALVLCSRGPLLSLPGGPPRSCTPPPDGCHWLRAPSRWPQRTPVAHHRASSTGSHVPQGGAPQTWGLSPGWPSRTSGIMRGTAVSPPSRTAASRLSDSPALGVSFLSTSLGTGILGGRPAMARRAARKLCTGHHWSASKQEPLLPAGQHHPGRSPGGGSGQGMQARAAQADPLRTQVAGCLVPRPGSPWV